MAWLCRAANMARTRASSVVMPLSAWTAAPVAVIRAGSSPSIPLARHLASHKTLMAQMLLAVPGRSTSHFAGANTVNIHAAQSQSIRTLCTQRPTLPPVVEEWTNKDFLSWLNDNGYAELSSAFESELLNGARVVKMEKEDFLRRAP
mmetsp:Transcript_109994/g.154258  ORF Transcript_109994/g.154258 Transcript_109994/m.154258 type:complete len:147 (+) Transcript_109994:73-513(+)